MSSLESLFSFCPKHPPKRDWRIMLIPLGVTEKKNKEKSSRRRNMESLKANKKILNSLFYLDGSAVSLIFTILHCVGTGCH